MIEHHLVRFFSNGKVRVYPCSNRERAAILAGDPVERWHSYWYGALLASSRGRVFSVEMVSGNKAKCSRQSMISRRNLEQLVKVIDSIEEKGRGNGRKGTTGKRIREQGRDLVGEGRQAVRQRPRTPR